MEDYPKDSQNKNTTGQEGDQPDLVSEALEAYSVDDKGKVVIPEGAPAYVVSALNLEKRRRDVNASYGKSEAEKQKLTAENKALKDEMANLAKPEGFSVEQQTVLDELRYSDVDAWYNKRREFEASNSKAVEGRVGSAIAEANKTATESVAKQVTLSRDEAIDSMLAQHNAANPELPITKDMLNLEVPPILVKRFSTGELDAPGFMASVSKFIYAGRTIKTEKVLGQPDLGAAPSSNTPSDNAQTEDLNALYAGI